MSERKKDYPVGYRRPPKATQFKPGQSGHPNGRPKGAKKSRTIWDEELKATVRISEGGKARRITKRRAMIRQAANKAAGGDMKAIAYVDLVAREHDAAAENASSIGPGAFDRPADAQTMASIVERMRLAVLESLAADAVGHTSTEAAADGEHPVRTQREDSPTPETDSETPDPKSQPEGDA